MISITKIFEFAAAHHLPYYKGVCNNLHGHNYKLEVTIRGKIQRAEAGSAQGMITDFKELKGIVKKAVLDDFDHCNLNELFDNPTAEIMVETIAKQLQLYFHQNIVVTKIRLWETSTSYATWEKDKC